MFEILIEKCTEMAVALDKAAANSQSADVGGDVPAIQSKREELAIDAKNKSKSHSKSAVSDEDKGQLQSHGNVVSSTPKPPVHELKALDREAAKAEKKHYQHLQRADLDVARANNRETVKAAKSKSFGR